jgi:hypothetical protein
LIGVTITPSAAASIVAGRAGEKASRWRRRGITELGMKARCGDYNAGMAAARVEPNQVETDVLINGSGGAGMYAAI